MDKKDLLTIKEFSVLTKTHPQSLRYYDAIGILKPVYVDPENGYRYYAFYQWEQVIPIQFYIQAGIPLTTLRDQHINEGSRTHPKDMIDQCISVLEDKIRYYQMLLDIRRRALPEFERCNHLLASDKPESYQIPPLDCFVKVFDPKKSEQSQIIEIIKQIHDCGLEIGWNYGTFLARKNGSWVKYVYSHFLTHDVIPTSHPMYLQIPGGHYLCHKIPTHGIEQALDWASTLIDLNDVNFIMEAELSSSDFDFLQPMYEQRCLIQTNGATDKNMLSSKSS